MAEAEGMPPTASVASVGPRINYIGGHCYAYNNASMSTDVNTVLSFTTGEGYIQGVIELTGPVSFTSGGVPSGDVVGLRIKFNDVVIAYIKSETSNEDMQIPSYLNVIIPPYTQVDCAFVNGSTASAYVQSVSMTGRVYDV
tara:strand:+ start:200 stop:622 length:423 start_codon:yes stop_codon:yes gene_type:complete